jgi:NADPH:quinone reductase-like Zn-dependent oxidoreductase
MSPTNQKALFLNKKAKEFVVGDVQVYKPGPGEVLIKIQAAALNPVDWKAQKIDAFRSMFPEQAIVGQDISGDIVEVGEGVTNFNKGDRV